MPDSSSRPLCRLGSFRVIDPPYRFKQKELLRSLSDIFANAAYAQGELPTLAEAQDLYGRLFERYGCKDHLLSTRYSYIHDFALPREEWEVFDPEDPVSLGGWSRRTAAFNRFTEAIFDQLFPSDTESPPANLVHTTCTSYQSPSAGQILASRRGWGANTIVTQVYHHGCYAVVPTLRVGAGLIGNARLQGRLNEAVADVVHTELHTLHADPVRRTPDHIIGHGLFGDGVISYRMWDPSFPAAPSGRCLELLATHEEILPETSDFMCWSIVPSGMHMVLDKRIPEAVGCSINRFIDNLFNRAGLDRNNNLPASALALHPGGPRIIDQVRDVLGIDEERVTWSRKVLFERGNISSATAPHMWADILADPTSATGSLITTIAFGPGLTAAGAILRVVEA